MKPYIMNYSDTISLENKCDNIKNQDTTTVTFTIENSDNGEFLETTFITDTIENCDNDGINYSQSRSDYIGTTFITETIENTDQDRILF